MNKRKGDIDSISHMGRDYLIQKQISQEIECGQFRIRFEKYEDVLIEFIKVKSKEMFPNWYLKKHLEANKIVAFALNTVFIQWDQTREGYSTFEYSLIYLPPDNDLVQEIMKQIPPLDRPWFTIRHVYLNLYNE